MTLALLSNVKPRVIEIINANPGVWSQTVSGEVGAFPHDNEITAAILEADELIVTRGYFNSVNDTLSKPFKLMSANVPSGEDIPFHYGNIGKVELSGDAVNWQIGQEAANLDDVLSAIAVGGGYVGANSFNHLYKIENGVFYHSAAYGRIELPQFNRTTLLQANQSEETLIIYTAIKLLTKNAANVDFAFYAGEADKGLQMLIQDGAYQPEGDKNP